MSDLDFLQRSSPSQIVGGDELFAADVSSRKDLEIADSIRESLVSYALSVGTTAIEITSGSSLVDKKAVLVLNNSNRTMFYGGSNVTISNGIPLQKGESVMLRLNAVALYIISDQASQNLRVLEVR